MFVLEESTFLCGTPSLGGLYLSQNLTSVYDSRKDLISIARRLYEAIRSILQCDRWFLEGYRVT